MWSHTSTALSCLALLTSAGLANAERLPLKGRVVGKAKRAAMYKRAQIAGPGSFDSGVDNSQDISYSVNVTIGGSPRSVLIDTGRCVACRLRSSWHMKQCSAVPISGQSALY